MYTSSVAKDILEAGLTVWYSGRSADERQAGTAKRLDVSSERLRTREVAMLDSLE